MRVNLNYNMNMIKKLSVDNIVKYVKLGRCISVKHTQGCYGKTTDCPQMTYHHMTVTAIYLYQDYADIGIFMAMTCTI